MGSSAAPASPTMARIRSRRIRGRRLAVLAAASAVASAALLAVGLVLLRPPTAPVAGCLPTTPSPVAGGQWYTLAPCGSRADIGPDSYYPAYQIVRLSDGETVYGEFQANQSIGAYMINASEVSQLEGDPHPAGPPASYFWTCGIVTSCNLSVKVPGSPGQYYILLENLGPAPVSVEWATSLAIYYEPG